MTAASERKIDAARAELLYRNGRHSNLTVLVAGILLAILFGRAGLGATALAWLSAMALGVGARLLLLVWRARAGESADPQAWIRRYTFVTGLLGIGWAVGVGIGWTDDTWMRMLMLLVATAVVALAVREERLDAGPVLRRDAGHEVRVPPVGKDLREEGREVGRRRLGQRLGEHAAHELADEAGLRRHARLHQEVEGVAVPEAGAQRGRHGVLAPGLALEHAQQVAQADRLRRALARRVGLAEPGPQPGHQVEQPEEPRLGGGRGVGAGEDRVEPHVGIGGLAPAGDPAEQAHGEMPWQEGRVVGVPASGGTPRAPV